jgi:general secretion pathway protein G
MNKKGFTLIELLVVIAIIGLLSTLAVVALGSARKKANDSKRLSDVKQVQTALELYYTDKNAYPIAVAPAKNLGDATHACLNTDGFAATGCANPYMGLVPAGPGTGEYYTYVTDATGSTYTISVTLEAGAGNFSAGVVNATPSGMTQPPAA